MQSAFIVETIADRRVDDILYDESFKNKKCDKTKLTGKSAFILPQRNKAAFSSRLINSNIKIL